MNTIPAERSNREFWLAHVKAWRASGLKKQDSGSCTSPTNPFAPLCTTSHNPQQRQPVNGYTTIASEPIPSI